MKKNTLLNKLGNISLVLGSIFICLVVLEVVIDKIIYVPKIEGLDFHSYGTEYILSDNRNLIYTPKPNVGQYNSYGSRGKEFTYGKKDKKRIIFLGDSVVEGLGVSVQNRFTELLNKLQNEKYEIINLAVRGYNFKQEIEYLKTVGLKFKPDYIFFGITYNDLVLQSGEIYNLHKSFIKIKHSSFLTHYYKTKSSIEKLLLKSNIYRLIRYRNYSTEVNFGYQISYRILPNEQKKILADLIQLSNKFNSKIFFIFLPINTNSEEKELLEFKKLVVADGFDLYDIDAVVSKMYKNKTDLFINSTDPCHLNVLGHKIVAEAINKFITSK